MARFLLLGRAMCPYRGCETPSDSATRRTVLKSLGAIVVSVAAGLSTGLRDADAASGSERRYPIPPNDGVTIDRSSQIIVVRFQNQLFAFNLACPHENTALKWLPKDRRFQCPKHESQYQPNGIFTNGRATRNMDRLGVRLDGNTLVVDLNAFFQSDKNPSGWAGAVAAV
jgi:nitrite reductase/ring-hydroxylating ferredoxin subunit